MSKAPHLGIAFYLHMYMIRTDTKAFSVFLQLQWTPKENTILNMETTTIEWVLCSPILKILS